MINSAFMVEATKYKTHDLLQDWGWLVPEHHTPLYTSVFGDWVFWRTRW
jgi:hypothetical protein